MFSTSLRFGSEADEINEQIQSCDNIIKYLLDQLDKFELKEYIHLFVLSDHGMISLKISDIIDLTQFINSEDVKFSGGSPTLEIFPAKSKRIHRMLSCDYTPLFLLGLGLFVYIRPAIQIVKYDSATRIFELL